MTLPKVARLRSKILFEVLASILVVLVLWLTVPAPDLVSRLTQIALGILAITGVCLRNLCPRTAFILALLSTGIATALGLTADPLLLAGVALNSVAIKRGRRALPRPMLGILFLGVFMALLFGADGSGDDMRGVLFGVLTLCGSWALGVKTREAQRLAASNATIEERMRLARDVHDVLSHSLGAIGVQAGVAAHIGRLGEEQLRSTLRDVEQLSRSSIAELKTLLKEARGVDEEAPSARTLSDLLVETARSAERSGIRATFKAMGIEELPATHSATVHRVVQESVNNMIRHSGASHCDIEVTVSGCAVAIRVTDNGHGDESDTHDGFGLRGMQERVNLLDGTLHAGNLRSGGFQVTAVLPLVQRKDGK